MRIPPRADDWSTAGGHGILGLYRAGAALQRVRAKDIAAAASLPGIVVNFRREGAMDRLRHLAIWPALPASIFISRALPVSVWSQALYKPENRLARLSKRQLPMNALNAVLGCCVLSALCIYALKINLDALIIYANGIFIMIYLLVHAGGMSLLKGRYKALAVVGGVLCLLLLAMVGWKSLYAIVMLAGLWAVFTEAEESVGPVSEATGQKNYRSSLWSKRSRCSSLR